MTEKDTRKSSLPLRALVALQTFQGLSGVAGGIGLMADPSGRALGIPVEWLEGTPFGSYLVPGLVLLTVLGIAPLAVVLGIRTRRSWSWSGSLLAGLALLVWLAVQISVVGYRREPPLQLVYGGVGVAIVVVTLLPAVREHLGRSSR